MPTKRITTEAIVQRGEEIYQSQLRERFDTPENRGKLLVIDVGTGECQLDEGGADAATRLLEQHPDAQLFFVRVGFRTAFDLFSAATVQTATFEAVDGGRVTLAKQTNAAA